MAILGKNKKNENDEIKESEVATSTKKFRFPENISLTKEGDFIEGIYKGVMVKSGEGMNGGDLILAVFQETESENIKTCVAGSQIVKFLQNFPIDKYLKIIRRGTKQTKNGNPFAVYTFECDRDISLDEMLLLKPASALTNEKLLTEKTEVE